MRLPPRVGAAAGRLARLVTGMGRQFGRYGLSDHAAAVTYWGFLSLFPALIVVVAVLGLVGSYPETYRSIVSTLRDATPGTTVDVVDSALRDALRGRDKAGGLLGIGLLLSLYSASSGIGAALRAINELYGVAHTESFLRGHVSRLGLTVALGAMLLLAFAAILVAGPIFSSIADTAGVRESVSSIVSLLRWPIGILALMSAAVLLYRVGARRPIRVVRLLPGASVAALLWVLASVGFTIYVSNFGSYDATYGSLGAMIVLLIWMWIGNLALLAGAAFNVELDGAGADRPSETARR